MKNKIPLLLLWLFLAAMLVSLQAMPPKAMRGKAAEGKTEEQKQEDAVALEVQGRRITDSRAVDLSSDVERGTPMGASEEGTSDEGLSCTDSANGSEEAVDNNLERERPTALFRAALVMHPEAERFVLVEESGNYTLAVRSVRSNAVWENLKIINCLRMALRQEYGRLARTIVSDVIGVSNLMDNNKLSAARLREILSRVDKDTAFFGSNVRYLEPILVTQLERLLDQVDSADSSNDREAQRTAQNNLKQWLRQAQMHAQRREENQEGAARYSQEYDSIANPTKELDEKWCLLYNAVSKCAVKKSPSIAWPQVGDEKRKFKRSYNRTRRVMGDFSSKFAKAIVDLNEGEKHPHILNLKTIHELAESSWKTLDEHLEKISHAYEALFSEISLKDNEDQHSIRNIATLWNEAATQTQLAEHLWNMGAKYATNVRLSEILKRANETDESRYNLGHVTSKEAQFLCESFVGSYFTRDLTDKIGTRLISEDQLKQSRFPEYKKPGQFTGWFGCRMANLQKKLENGLWTNGHLIVSDIYDLTTGDPDDHYVLSSEDESELKTASGTTTADATEEENTL